MKSILILLAALLVGCGDSFVTSSMIQESTKLCGEAGLKSLRVEGVYMDKSLSIQAVCNNDAVVEWRDRAPR